MRVQFSHYVASCYLNRFLLGNRFEPLCSRVYRMKDCAFRSFYLAAMNRLFREPAHCERIFLVYLMRKTPYGK